MQRAVCNSYLRIENSSFAHHLPIDEVSDLALSISKQRSPRVLFAGIL